MARKAVTDEVLPTEDLFTLMAKEAGKQFKNNPGAILDDYTSGQPTIWYSTGIPTADVALAGGLAGGMASMFGGTPNAGKSTLLYSAIAEAQRIHPVGFHDIHVIADPENSTTAAIAHMRQLGVDTSKVYIIAPENGVPLFAEDIFARLEWFFRQAQKGGPLDGRLGIVGLDSIGALVSKTAHEQSWDKAGAPGGNAKIITRFVDNVVGSGLLFNSKAHLLFLNQVRDAIGDMWTEFTFPGGKSLEHACVQIMAVTRTLGKDFLNPNYNSKLDNQLEAQYIGQKIKFKQEKSKVGGIKGATASVNFYYGQGLDILQNMVDLGRMYGVVDGTTWLSFVDPITGEVIAKAQGGNAFKKLLADDEQLYKKFEYVLSYTMRNLEVQSVVEDWPAIHMELFGEEPPTAQEEAEEETVTEEAEEAAE